MHLLSISKQQKMGIINLSQVMRTWPQSLHAMLSGTAGVVLACTEHTERLYILTEIMQVDVDN